MAPVFAIISAFFYGVSMVMARVGLKSVDTFSGAIISIGFSFIGSLFIFIYYVPVSHFANWGVLYFIIAGLSGPCIGRILLFKGINRVGTSIASLLYSTKPLFSAVAALLILGESLTFMIAVATVIMVAGLAIVSSEETGGQIERSWSKKDLLFPIMAGAAYGIAHVLRKIGLNIKPDPMMGVVIQNTAALSFSLAFAFLNRNNQRVIWNNQAGWIFFGLSGIFSILGQVMVFHALNIGNVIIVSPLSSISPIFVIIITAIFLRRIESVTRKIILGAVLILSGTFVLALFPGY